MYEIDSFLNDLFRASIYPGIILIIWLYGLISTITLKICLLLFLAIFVIGPIIFKHSVEFQRKLFFLSFVNNECDFKHPETTGIYGTRNFYIKYKDTDLEQQIKIGVWHSLPIQICKKFTKELKLTTHDIADILNTNEIEDENLNKIEIELKKEFSTIDDNNAQLFYEKMLQEPGTVIIYLHGNSGNRGKGHRIELYKVLQKLGYHVLALDYRNFGDSDAISPTEEGCIKDAFAVYNYVKNITSNPVFIWGHSLGTGVSTHFLSQMNQFGLYYGPKGVILESPFTNINEELNNYPMAFFFKYLPWFDYTIAKPIYSNSLRFESNQHINEFRQPIIILHAEDDYVVPFKLGYKLYRIALDMRGKNWGPIEFHRFEGSSHYGHRFLCRAPNLPQIIKNFVNNYKNETF